MTPAETSRATTPAPDLLPALMAIVGTKYVLTEPADKQPFEEDWWGRVRGDALCVVLPGSTAEVSAVVETCRRCGAAVYPQGGNTSTCYGAVPDTARPGIVVALTRMNAVLHADAGNNSLTVQAGCTLMQAQEAARAVDRLFPMSLGAEGTCQVGGNIATNAGGTAVVRYGNTRDLVLGLEVVLPDGRIWNGLRALRKNNTGYDLKNLFVGSEGTLGIVTAAVLKLFPRQDHFTTLLMAVPTIESATAVGALLASRFPAALTALELLSASEIDLVARYVPGVVPPLPLSSPWFLLVDLAEPTAESALAAVLEERLSAAIEEGLVADAVVATSDSQRDALWRIRHSVTESHKKHGVGLSHDIAVPIAAIPAFVHRAGTIVAERFPEAAVYVVGHLGDGNLHYNVLYDHAAWKVLPDAAATRRQVYDAVYDVAAELGGTFSAEHGIGALHVAEMARYKDPVELDLMRAIKSRLDPADAFNPGRVLPQP